MIRTAVAAVCLLALGGCVGSTPNDVAAGVGFQDYTHYEARRAQLLSGPVVVRPPAPPAMAAPAPAGVAVTGPAQVDTITSRAAAAIAAAEATQASPVIVEASAQPTAPPPAATNVALASASNPGISDEQDFSAVSARETIASDAERRERMQEQLVIVQPTAIPARNGATGPNIVDFALRTTNSVGERIYTRMPFRQGQYDRNCIAFRSDDLAQETFLAEGGPERDRHGLDPDGDGFACDWNPVVYRLAAQAAAN